MWEPFIKKAGLNKKKDDKLAGKQYMKKTNKLFGLIAFMVLIGLFSTGCAGQFYPVRTDGGLSSGVDVSPPNKTMTTGSSFRFTAMVAGSNYPDNVTWIVSSNATGTGVVTSGTGISASGVLTVVINETLATLYVIATSVANPSMSGLSVVKIVRGSSMGQNYIHHEQYYDDGRDQNSHRQNPNHQGPNHGKKPNRPEPNHGGPGKDKNDHGKDQNRQEQNRGDKGKDKNDHGQNQSRPDQNNGGKEKDQNSQEQNQDNKGKGQNSQGQNQNSQGKGQNSQGKSRR